MEYYERIKNLREDNDITQKEVAALLGTSQSYYAQYENGKRPIPFERIIQIANILNISIDYLAGRTDKKQINR